MKAEKLKSAASLWRDNIGFMSAYAKARNIKSIFVIQPFVGFSKSVDDSPARAIYFYREPLAITGFEALKGEVRRMEKTCVVDSNEALALETSQGREVRFSDDVHFRDNKGYQFLTDVIVKGLERCYQ